MRARVLTLRFDPVLDAVDDSLLRRLASEHTLIGVSDHAFVHDGSPRLVLVVTYSDDGAVPPEDRPETRSDESRGDHRGQWRQLLNSCDLPLFNTLREWRAERARTGGVPPYVICTNKQLAMLVRAQPNSLAKIGEVEGFGKAKIEKYGREMLAFFRGAPHEVEDAGEGGPDELE